MKTRSRCRTGSRSGALARRSRASVPVRFYVKSGRQVRQRVDAALIEGIESGPSTSMTTKDWDDIRREGRRRLAKGKKDR